MIATITCKRGSAQLRIYAQSEPNPSLNPSNGPLKARHLSKA